MSTTPRTEEAVRKCHNLGDICQTTGRNRYVDADFARQLELENTKLLEVSRAAKEYHGEHLLYIEGRCSLCDAIKSIEETVKP